jgi:signal transduction histidine kinase
MASAIAVLFLFQGIWLRQLYLKQEEEVKKDIQSLVAEASKRAIYRFRQDAYYHETFLRTPNVDSFFMSRQWADLRHAFDDMPPIRNTFLGFQYNANPDSITIQMSFKIMGQKKKLTGIDDPELTEPDSIIQTREKSSLHFMDSTVRKRLHEMEIISPPQYALRDYGFSDSVLFCSIPIADFEKLLFKTEAYSYNLNHLKKYQLGFAYLGDTVFYRLRYFMLSALALSLLIVLTFYFLLKFIKNQRLYTEARMEFTNNMTHEFKTPVATVAVALESILTYKLDKDPPKLRHYIEMSQSELRRLNLMIEKVLNLSKLDTDSNFLQKEKIDLQELITDVIASMQLISNDKQADVQFEARGEDFILRGDKTHLANVFYNLLDNALKYATEKPTIQITLTSAKENLIAAVKDNGIGIPADFHHRVFDRFFRIPSHDIHNVKGFGLGLTYVRDIVEKQGGHIRLESGVGSGTVFTITLPK